ncbi:putative cytochrome b [Trypanosoma theileri]|uniref:Putative cytochrome b n=1 Tax=Trypanosoma theileri TaxID=67003 RepID=A0A1X0NSE1_9TRYP|nr:putative cytochrome b [Trypanosoma theileri]ORC87531.1 putative cytochrome b [Trypanosoma theileri]
MEGIEHRHQPDFLISQKGPKGLFSACSSSSYSSSINSSNCLLDRRSLPPSPSPTNALHHHPLSVDPIEPSTSVSVSVSSSSPSSPLQAMSSLSPPAASLQGRRAQAEVTQSGRLGTTSALPFCSEDGFCLSLTPEIVNSIPRGRVPCHLGCSMRDWSHLMHQQEQKKKVEYKQGVITRGGKSLPRLSMHEVMQHTTADDLWLVIRGVVYDCTKFQHFHPGGGRLLMQCAGKDCTALYDYYHRWVSCEGLLAPFAVGVIDTTNTQQQQQQQQSPLNTQ